MFDSWRKKKAQDEELNLIPIMNLMVTLIPFLLLGAAFYHLGTIPASLPQQAAAASGEKPKDIKVTLTMEVKLDTIRVSGTAVGLDDASAEGLKKTFANRGAPQDLKALQDHLVSIKSQYPKSDTVVVIPEETIRYEMLVTVLDTIREKKLPGVNAKGEARYASLFPVTVFTKRNKPPPEKVIEEDDAAEEAVP
ncbi:MAG: biopolymer transporter ExbD [Myxococcota bacterium]|nr:biopolymer transporter ExbD [Myxococcota bacterium]